MGFKKITFFVVIITSLFVINHLVHTIYTLWQKKNLVVKEHMFLEVEKKKNANLKKQLALVNKPQFIEEEARDKLFLSKPGEGVVVIPSNLLKPTPSAASKSQDTRQNWEKWWDLFF